MEDMVNNFLSEDLSEKDAVTITDDIMERRNTDYDGLWSAFIADAIDPELAKTSASPQAWGDRQPRWQ